MNAKKAKTLRRALRAAGVDLKATEYATRTNTKTPFTLARNTGRKAYAVAKKMAR